MIVEPIDLLIQQNCKETNTCVFDNNDGNNDTDTLATIP